MSMTQRDGVFKAVCTVLGITDEDLKERGGSLGKVELSIEQKREVHAILVPQFVKGEINYEGSISEEEAKKYVGGLTNNWLRKDKRLNGGEKYQPKNPGQRQGSGDESIKAMKVLLGVTQDPTAKKEIEAEIAKRKEQLEAAKRPALDVSKLPEHLRHLAPKSAIAASTASTSDSTSESADESSDTPTGDMEPVPAT